MRRIFSRENRETITTPRDGQVFTSSRTNSTSSHQTLLACATYVDLNPVRAAIAETIEGSDFASVQRRVQALQLTANNTPSAASMVSPDAILAPISLDERTEPIGPRASTKGSRCSDKGFLAMSAAEYVEVVECAARVVVSVKRGSMPPDAPPILERLGIEPTDWSMLVKDFGRLYSQMAGTANTLSQARSKRTHRRFHRRRLKQELIASS